MKTQDEKQNQSLGSSLSPLYMGGAALRTEEALPPENSETPFCQFQKNLKALEGKVSRLSFMTGEIREILKKRP